MKKLLLIALLFPLKAFGSSTCPQWTYPENQKIGSEFANVCYNIAYPNIVNATVSSMTVRGITITSGTFSNITISTFTASSATVTNLNVKGTLTGHASLDLPLTGGTMSGTIAFSPSTNGIVGTTTNDNAAAGKVGESVSQVQANVSAGATGTFSNITNISLTAGDWNVSGWAYGFSNSATMTGGFANLALSAFTGNTTTDQVAGDNQAYFIPPGATNTTAACAIPDWRVSIAGTTTIYLKGLMTFSAGTPQWNGRISARRMR